MALFFGPTLIASAVPGPQRMPAMGTPQLDQLSGDAFDQAFLTEMTMHHAMGVMMTRPVAASGAHQELKALGARMIADQSREIAQMRGWLQTWYGQDVACPVVQGMMPTLTGRSMPGLIAPDGIRPGWMLDPPTGRPIISPMRPGAMQPGTGMPMMPGGPIGTMPGMPMTGMPMMGGFQSLPPDQLDATFMTWMIEHHQGAVDMAALAEERAAHQEVKDLATSIMMTQSAEIETMQAWLAAWYGR
jgi:uncharacterized protein (DUF305 family)